MSLITPSSTVSLYENVDITDGKTVVFSSKANQTAYFSNKRVSQRVDCTYIRKSGRLRIEYPTSTVSRCNYISFNNVAFENTTFYAKIVDYEYVNNVTTDILFSIDWFQTLMFDVTYEHGLIEREHLSQVDYDKSLVNPWDDSIYEFHTAENLACTGYMMKKLSKDDVVKTDFGDNYYILVVAARDEDEWKTLIESTAFAARYGDGSTLVPNEWLDEGLSFGELVITTPIDIIMINKSRDGVVGKENQNLYDIINYLTLHDSTHDIIGLYKMPETVIKYFFTNKSETYHITPPSGDTVKNKKLLWGPYTYLEVRTATDVKEYRYENFANQSQFSFELVITFAGKPLLSVIPYSYFMNYYTEDNQGLDSASLNGAERIDIEKIPQLPYQTDSYLSFISSQYQNFYGRTDLDVESDYQRALKTLQPNYTQKTTPDNTLIPFLVDTFSTAKNIMSSASEYASTGVPYSQLSAANTQKMYESGYADGDYISGAFTNAKKAYTSHNYVAGAGDILPYYFNMAVGTDGNSEPSPFNFAFIKRTLKTEIMNVYDDYFTEYGYASNRVGTPRVCNYITGNGLAPHFDTDGTYVKTSNMKVDHVIEDASRYISDMFNKGCRFIKGD